MIENEKRVRFKVVSPKHASQITTAPTGVVLSEPMRRFNCNQKGCCCSGWDIPFRLEDFLRLHEHLPPAERAELTNGIKLIVDSEQKGEKGETILHALKLDPVGKTQACRFLEPVGTCRVHAQSGLDALPDLCVDFPAFTFHREDGAAEMWFDPVCPEVLAQIDESDAPLGLHRQEGKFENPMMDLRVTHASDNIIGRIGKAKINPAALDRIRADTLAQLARADRPAWHTLAVLLDGYSYLQPDKNGECALVLNQQIDPTPFLRFFWACIAAHGPDLLVASMVKYRRFVYAIDPAPIVAQRDLFEEHLTKWEANFEKFVSPQDDVLAPLFARYLSHRFGTPMVKGRADLRAAADEIVHLFATAMRYAAGMGAIFGKPIDRKTFLVSLGASEFFFRSLKIPREALPWFASREPDVIW